MRAIKIFFLTLAILTITGLIAINLIDIDIPQTEKVEFVNISPMRD